MDDITSNFGKKITQKELVILALIEKKPCTISELSRALKMDYKNTWRYCKNLYEKGIICLTPSPEESKKGSPVLASIILKNDEGMIYSILNRIRTKGKRISLKEFYDILNEIETSWEDDERKQKLGTLYFLDASSEFIQKDVSLTKKAKEFLKEQDRKRNLKASIKKKIIEKGKL